jgi:hypothetical protein
MGVYRVGQVCLSGHAITDAADAHPERQERRCSRCGAETILKCPKCAANIRGDYHVDGVFGGGEWTPPRFCHECGQAYQWTQAKISTTNELIDELDELSDEDKVRLKSSVDELVRDAPSAEIAALRVKKAFLRLGKLSGDSLRQLLVDILSETAKKMMGL